VCQQVFRQGFEVLKNQGVGFSLWVLEKDL